MQVEIWSDVVCPWCYIGKRHLEAALERFPHAAEVEITWKAFELDPSALPSSGGSSGRLVERLARKYGVSLEEAQAMNERVAGIAADDGLQFRFDIAKPGNTFDAHRLIELALEVGGRPLQGALKERLLSAYQCEGESISDHDVLRKAALDVGLDGAVVDEVLAGDAHGAAVRADEQEARDLDVRGVPFFVFDRKYAVSGAQPADALLEVLERAWAERPQSTLTSAGDPDVDACGPDGCEVPGR